MKQKIGNLICYSDKEKQAQIVHVSNEFKTNLHDSSISCSTQRGDDRYTCYGTEYRGPQMNNNNRVIRKLRLHVQMSIDGCIAGPNNEMDWLVWDNDYINT